MGLSVEDILGVIRDNSSVEYQERIPEYNKDNLIQIGDTITADKNVMNEFMDNLINKVALTVIKSRMYHNPLAKLKSGIGRPMGSTIEELFINPATDMGYQKDGTYLLKTTKPDGKSAYYGLNRQSTYPVSIYKKDLVRAFQSERAFNSFYESIISSLYSGDQMDEFSLSKSLFGKNIANGNIKKIECDLAQPKELAKSITNMSDFFQFPSEEFNGYNLVNKSKFTDTDKKVITFTPENNLCLVVRADVLNEINYEVLASMFHMEVAEIKAMTVKVDSFNDGDDFETYAVLMDKEGYQIIDDVYETDNQYIGSSMMWNIWLHHWQWLYISMFANVVAFGKSKTPTTKQSSK